MPFWSKKQPSVGELTTQYNKRSRQRLELVASTMEHLENAVSRDRPDMGQIVSCRDRLRKLADDQHAEVVPLADLQTHNDLTFRLMDIEARKAQDLIETGGQNIASLIAESEDVNRLMDEHEATAHRQFQERGRAYGIEPPDFSKD
jgi:uncharacterized coiled-coil DUF342 family protein